jgi:hypothetical protein
MPKKFSQKNGISRPVRLEKPRVPFSLLIQFVTFKGRKCHKRRCSDTF